MIDFLEDAYYNLRNRLRSVKCLVRGYHVSGRQAAGRFDDDRCYDCRTWCGSVTLKIWRDG